MSRGAHRGARSPVHHPSRRWTRRRARAAALAAGALSLLGTVEANALTVDFESLPPGSDVAAAVLPGVAISGALVLDEALVATLLGLPTEGTWNTTPGGDRGALNVLDPQVLLLFDLPVTSLSLRVLALPDEGGGPGRVALLGFAGDVLVASDLSDPGLVGDSGFPEDTLSVSGAAITRALLCPAAPGDVPACLEPGLPTTLWLDDVAFTPIPEPGALALVGTALAGLAAGRRTR